MTDIVKINASDYGLDSTKAKEIEAMFTPMLEKMKSLEKEYNEILKLPIDLQTCYRAKELRLQYVRVRTGTAEIHKELKAFYLNGGRFVDGWKNAQLFASQQIEETLKKIETHYEIIEAEKKAKLKAERIVLIQPYVEDVNTFMLGEMTQAAFDILLSGAKGQYEARIAAEKKAEEDRIAKEKADAAEREKQRLENIQLKAEAEEKERLAEIERKKNERILAMQKAKADKERAELFAKAEVERKEKERLAEIERKKNERILAVQKAKADKKRAELLAKAEAERKEKERLEKEIADRKAADEKAKKDAELKLQAEAKAKAAEEKKAGLAPEKTKLLSFMQAINDLPRPEVKSIEAADIVSKANIYLMQASNYIRDNAGKL